MNNNSRDIILESSTTETVDGTVYESIEILNKTYDIGLVNKMTL